MPISNKYFGNNNGNGINIPIINLDKIVIFNVVLQFLHSIFLYPEKVHIENSNSIYEKFSLHLVHF